MALARPYDGNRIWPLVVLLAACLALVTGAVVAAGGRDIRGGYLRSSSGRAARTWLLGSVQAFAVRRLARPLAAWSAGVGAYYLLIGVLAVSMTDFLTDNPRFAELAAQAGFTGLGTVPGYTATLFALLAVPAGAFVAVRLAALAADEASRRLTLLYGQPLTRATVLTGEVAAAGRRRRAHHRQPALPPGPGPGPSVPTSALPPRCPAPGTYCRSHSSAWAPVYSPSAGRRARSPSSDRCRPRAASC